MSTLPTSSTTETTTGERPTRIRHLVVFVTVLMAVILYLDRYCVSLSGEYIKEDLGLTAFQMELFISAFFWAYALAQVPAGWLGDRFGSRGVLAFYIVSWSFFTGMVGLAGGALLLIVMRFGCGLSQAGAYPTAGSLLSRWVPFSSRGFASGLVALGGRVGVVIVPILTAWLMVKFVPESASSELTERELLNAPALCVRLGDASGFERNDGHNPVGQRIADLLPDDARLIVEQYAELSRSLKSSTETIDRELRQRAAAQSGTTDTGNGAHLSANRNAVSQVHLTAEELRILCAGLNEALRQPDLVSDADFRELRNAEREAIGLQERRQAGQSLSQMEIVRLNRLVLEAVFPAEIGKLYVKGWRPVMFVYGIAGLAVAGLFWLFFRNSPAEHGWCNGAERALISGSPAPPAPTDVQPFPGREILRSRSLWLSSVSQFTTNAAWLFFVTSLPRYLMEVYQVPILERGLMVSIPALAGIVGMFLGGKLTDVLSRAVGLRWGRALPMGLTRFLAAAAYLACLWTDTPWMATIAFALGFFSVDLGVSAVWAFMQDVGGKYIGAILGWGNMWGNVGAAVAPHLYGLVLGESPKPDDWNTMFVICAGLFVVSGVTALGIDATVPIAASPDKANDDAAGDGG